MAYTLPPNVIKGLGWNKADLMQWMMLQRLEFEARPKPKKDGKWETADEIDDRIYGGGTLRREDLKHAIYNGIADAAEEVTLNMAEQAAVQVASTIGTPLAGKTLEFLGKQGWKLFKKGSQYVLHKEIKVGGKTRIVECKVGVGCFAEGTPLLTPDGWRAIEAFAPGDEILTRDEDDESGPVHAQVVEGVSSR